MLELLLALSLAWALLAPSAGRYQILTDSPSSIVRLDTASGQMERCRIIGRAIDCQPLDVAGR